MILWYVCLWLLQSHESSFAESFASELKWYPTILVPDFLVFRFVLSGLGFFIGVAGMLGLANIKLMSSVFLSVLYFEFLSPCFLF